MPFLRNERVRIYLAARYSRRLELCEYRTQLESLGHEVTSSWLNGSHQISDAGVPIGEHGESLVEGDDGSTTDKAAELRAKFAENDFLDVDRSDLLIAFTEPPRSGASRGGRHVEFGIALGRGVPVWIVGHRENIFAWLPQVAFFNDFSAVMCHFNLLEKQAPCCG